MAKRTKTAGANLPVPQNREEAEEFIRTIGAHQRAVARVKLDLAETVAGLKEESDKAREPYETAIERLTEGLKMWCEANRAAITDNNRVKHADFLAGKVLWRIRSPKVTHPGVEAEEIVGRIRRWARSSSGSCGWSRKSTRTRCSPTRRWRGPSPA